MCVVVFSLSNQHRPIRLGPRPTVQEDPSASKEEEELALEVKKAQELWDSKSEKIMKEYKADVEKSCGVVIWDFRNKNRL